MTNDTKGLERKARVLFFAFGDSIHARRRIGLFIDDPEFSVAVASTFDYNFAGALNILLTPDQVEKGLLVNLLVKVINRVAAALGWLLSIRESGRGFFKNYAEFKNNVLLAMGHLKVVRAAIRGFKPDVVFLQTLMYPSYISFFLPKSIPVVITFWNGDLTWWAKWNGIERWFKKRITAYGLYRASAITVNSRAASDACMGYGAYSNKVHIIRYPGVDLKRFFPVQKETAREKLGITARKLVLCPRGIGGYLNSDIIISAASTVVKEHPDVFFLVVVKVWDGEEMKRHREVAQELGVADNIIWKANIPWEDMPGYYCASDVMVSISSNDSLPNSMLEAMACGVPVIMGDIPQIRDWVTDGENGFLVPPRDAAALSNRILEVVDCQDNKVKEFPSRNIELIAREMNSEKNISRIKELVRQVAGKALGS